MPVNRPAGGPMKIWTDEATVLAAEYAAWDKAIAARDELPRGEQGTFNMAKLAESGGLDSHEVYDGRTDRYREAQDRVMEASRTLAITGGQQIAAKSRPPEPPDSCPACGSEARAECYYVPGMTGMPVTCSSDWHDEDARAPGDHLVAPEPAPKEG